jgi:predicted ribosome quality control (RQC) complex YloA/Tae2 family protein
LLYMGRDKHENEVLIKNAWPEDVWFHVDKESSAHVYIRLPRGSHKSGDPEWYKRIHPKVVEDCCQLVKANSIKGNKLDNVSVVFTPASNLKKTASMEIGQVKITVLEFLRRAVIQQTISCLLRTIHPHFFPTVLSAQTFN